jgi:hypothetical protein
MASQEAGSHGTGCRLRHRPHHIAAALEQGPLVSQGAHERDVVGGQALERPGQAERLPAHALQVTTQVDRLGPNQHLEVGQLGVEKLSAARQQFLLLPSSALASDWSAPVTSKTASR